MGYNEETWLVVWEISREKSGERGGPCLIQEDEKRREVKKEPRDSYLQPAIKGRH